MNASSTDVPPSGPAAARFAGTVIGGRPSVRRYYDQDESNAVAILTCDAAPAEGWTTCSTVTLHVSPNMLDGRDVRVELMASARSTDESLANVVATAAFLVAKDHWLAAPGVVFPNLIREYFPTTTTPHVMWSEPFPWMSLADAAVEGIGQLHWLLAIPLSEAERTLLADHGADQLESRLATAGAEYFDLWRASTV